MLCAKNKWARNWKCIAAFTVVTWLSVAPAPGALAVINGDFQTTPGFNANVALWFDGTNGGNPWEDTFQDTNPQPPAAGTEVVFSGNVGTNPQNFLYQSLGTKEATDGTLNFSVNIGNFSTATSYRSGTLQVNLFQSASFVGADGTDILGAGGVTQIGATVIKDIERGTTLPLTFPNSAYETGSFSLATANTTDPIYLRFHWTMGEPDAYIGADLVTITVDAVAEAVPEPSSIALAALALTGLGMGAWRQHRRRGSSTA